MLDYVDSSVYLRILLAQPGAMILPAGLAQCTGSITRLEISRLLYRLLSKGKLAEAELRRAFQALDALLSGVSIVPCDSAILESAAAPLAEPLGALDAIHLAGALRAKHSQGQPVRLRTHSVELAIAARAAGLEAITQ